jgi:Icc-related predicted phosphoesterase
MATKSTYRFLCVSDGHGRMPTIADSAGFNAWFYIGGMARWGDGKQFVLWSMRQTIPIVSVSGHEDSGVFGSLLLAHYSTNVTGSAVRIADSVMIVGVGFCTEYPPIRTARPTENRLAMICADALRSANARRRPGDSVILLTHYPPKLSVPGYDGDDPGFYHCMRPLIEQLKPVAVIHGHVRHRFGTQVLWQHKNGHTLIACPGPAPHLLTLAAGSAVFSAISEVGGTA